MENLQIAVLEASAAVLRMQARERAERDIGGVYGPAIGKYLRLTAKRLTAKLSRIESQFNDLSASESGASAAGAFALSVPSLFGIVGEADPTDLPPSIRATTESLLDEGLEEIQDNILRPTTLALSRGLEAGWKRAVNQFKALGLDLTGDLFNVRNPEAVEWVASEGANLVRRIDNTSKGIIRGLVVDGVSSGKSYQKVAREIRARFKDDSSFSGRVPGPKHIRTRAELISVTEIGNAYEEGTIKVVERLDKTTRMEKRWETVGDNRVSSMDIANASEGWILLARTFSSGHGRPLSHPGCRCTNLYRTKRGRKR